MIKEKNETHTVHPLLKNDSETKVAWNYIQFEVKSQKIILSSNFWPLFVTNNGILRFSAFGLIKWSWIKNSKWNYPQFRGCGSENFIVLNVWPLFVTKNGILRFSAFGWTKWSWLKNSKINGTTHNIWVHDSENLVGLNYWPLFVTTYCILCLSAFDSIKRSWVQKSNWNHLQFGDRGYRKLCNWIFQSSLWSKTIFQAFSFLQDIISK